MLNFKEEIITQYQTEKLNEYKKEKIKEIQKIKTEIQTKQMSNEIMYVKCKEYIDTIHNIFEIEKEFKKLEKGATNNDKSTNEK